MCFARLNRLRATIKFRFTLWYSGLFMISTAVLFGVAYLSLAAALQRRDHEAIQLELQDYAADYQRGGPEAVAREMETQEGPDSGVFFFVRLAGPDNATISLSSPRSWRKFNLTQLPIPRLDVANGWTQLSAQDDEDVLELAWARLPDGAVLQVGLNSEEREDVLERFRALLAAILLPVGVIGLGGGAFFAARALRPIRGFVQTLESILATGKFTARAPVMGVGDELDEMSALFNRMLDKIEQLIAGMRNALDNVAHDLRTPMTRLRGMAEIALQMDDRGEGARHALANCLEESDRILAMLTTLMDISEAETGTLRLDRKLVQVREIVEHVMDLYSDVAEDKRIAMSVAVPHELYVVADPSRLQQVLANLLDNAVKYTPAQGCVTIAGARRDSHVVITVTDTGMGIAAEDLPRIWDRLYRGDKSRAQRGLGLGLSVVKAIVHAHGGTVAVSSWPGHGTEISLSLPI